MRTIDIHTHVLTEETMGLLRRVLKIGPKLTAIDADFAVLDVAGVRTGVSARRLRYALPTWRRLVEVQVLSATPQTFFYDQEPSLAVVCAALQNDQIAKLVKAHPDRFMGIATLPMQAPQRAAEELRRAVRSLGLRGAMIGSNVQGRNLDDPALEQLWAEAAALGAFMIVHPMNVAGTDRLRSYYLNNLIGNPLDTTIAAACLVFGGVLERHPNLKVLLVHGGGFVPFQAGRWVHGWQVRPEPKVNVKQSPQPWIDRFYYDTILHAQQVYGEAFRRAIAYCVLSDMGGNFAEFGTFRGFTARTIAGPGKYHIRRDRPRSFSFAGLRKSIHPSSGLLRWHRQSGRKRNTRCAVAPRIFARSPSEKRAACTTLVGSGSPIGNGASEPSITRSALAFFARYSSESASNTHESKYMASKPLRGSAYLPCAIW
jgi:aminocarboxymuconate-semialdehyde decarboxylase